MVDENNTSAVAASQASTAVASQPAPQQMDISALMGSKAVDSQAAPVGVDAVVEAEVDNSVQLSPEDQAKADEIAKTVDFTKTDIDQTFAADAQRSMTTFNDRILEKTKNKDTGEAGKYLSDLLETIDNSGLDKVPVIGTAAMKLKAMKRKYDKVDDQMDEIVGRLEKARATMISDIAMYDKMYDQNLEQYKQLKIYVAAGKKALADFYANQMPGLEKQVEESGDAMQAQVLKDFKDKLERFAKRLDDLDRVSVICLQTAPQIKILQNADKTLADKINTTITTTIPVWKSQMVLALGLANQEKAIKLQEAADDLTNKLLNSVAQQVHQGAVKSAQAGQRSVIDIETIENVNNELISTLKETVQIQKEGRAAREAAEGKMRQVEVNLKNALIEQANNM